MKTVDCYYEFSIFLLGNMPICFVSEIALQIQFYAESCICSLNSLPTGLSKTLFFKLRFNIRFM
jgi:hypothetical protein